MKRVEYQPIYKMYHTDELKLTDAQNVIRKKFAKAHTIRLEHERDVNQAIQPLMRKSVKRIDSVDVENKQVDLNALCNRLRILLAVQNAGQTNHAEEISTIIAKMHELEILI